MARSTDATAGDADKTRSFITVTLERREDGQYAVRAEHGPAVTDIPLDCLVSDYIAGEKYAIERIVKKAL